MQTKIYLLALFLLTSCGNTAKLDTAKLESFSNVTTAGTAVLDKTGMLIRKDGDQRTNDVITYSGVSYIVSMYSSHSALEYVAARPMGYQGQVKFKGTAKGNEVVLEALESN